ncbi:hypothetical protein, partial [Vibrio cholerae]|uniref:hypothetical protein n=1 Tax=Vibrio cholerae TaxID=666 RepID=UPI002FDC659D
MKAEKLGCSDKDYKDFIKEGETRYDQFHGRYAKEFDSTYLIPRRLTSAHDSRRLPPGSHRSLGCSFHRGIVYSGSP